MQTKRSQFYQRFLNNKFAVFLIDIVLVLLAILLFSKITWVFTPVANFLSIVAPPFILAGILFYMLNPVVNWFHRRGMNRLWAIGLVFLLLIGILALAITRVVPPIESQVRSFISAAPSYWDQFVKWATDLNNQQNLFSDKQLNQFATEIQNWVTKRGSTILSGTLSSLSSIISTVGTVVVTLGTAPIVLFFMLKEGNKFTPMILHLIPTKQRQSFGEMLHEMNLKIGSYVQGQLTVALAVGIIYMLGYSIIGLRYGLIFGMLAAPLNLIPYFGSALALVPALIMGAIQGPKMVIAVVIVFFIEWLLETQLISPFVMGSKLEMHPITIVVVLLTAGSMFGLLGVILGIPGFAVIKIIAVRLFKWYQQVSGLYPSDPPTSNLPANAQEKADEPK
ncbi:AI-2E family transporter [Lacticaseibacillus jixianensis]|uniref:AI-2E family transporter n=1 Tax=Lacticaseibacillus jixianensis TaxID=2486012 RepID=A0ABW4BAT2_9LACO|nr:AI-2E family transporter [Lacticaseibacillus jixianensis]